jgi:hypothetical protein
MQKNVGTTEKIIRVIIGLVIIILGLVYNTWWGLIGLIPLATAAIGWCPINRLIGLDTTKNKPAA